MYQQFKASVLGKRLSSAGNVTDPYGVQCVVLDWAYAAYLYPSVAVQNSITTGNANTIFDTANPAYFTKVLNDHNNPNQVPPQGAIMCFDGTPAAGYTNTFVNPDGHTGICDSANASGYYLLQENAPSAGEGVNVTFYPWKFRPCKGWLIPKNLVSPTPAPAPSPVQVHTITFPKTFNPVHLYPVGGPYVPSHAKAVLVPSAFPGGITERIIAEKPGDIYTIQTQDFGIGDVYMAGSQPVVK